MKSERNELNSNHNHSLVHENVSVESERPPAEEASFEEMRFLPVIITAAMVPHSVPHIEEKFPLRNREIRARVSESAECGKNRRSRAVL